MSRRSARATSVRVTAALIAALAALTPLPGAAAYPGDLVPYEPHTAEASSERALRDEATRGAVRRAALDIGEAFWVTDLRHEPNLNDLTLRYTSPPHLDGGGDATAVSRLVSLASRRQLSPAEAWQQHVTRLLAHDAGCPAGTDPTQCLGLRRWEIPRFDPAADGALEQQARSRTRGAAVGAFDYLNVAFEIDVWRPPGVHPMLAEAARNSAAVMRLRTASGEHPCGVTALWVLAAVIADIPEVTHIDDGEWHRSDRVVELRSITGNAAVRGCRAAAALAEQYVRLGVEAPAWPFWEPHLVNAVSDAAASGIADVLDRMTAGSLGSNPRSPLPDNVPALTGYRACDQQPPVLPLSETVVVRGFRVAPCLADSLRAMLDAASAEGIVLKGWGWRSTLTQIELRRRYCPLPPASSSQYWLELALMEATACSPPVARPRASMHESGRAVDFSCGAGGLSMRPGVSCFEWLSANAHHYGLYNFVLEPWHWSTNGR